MLFWLKLIVHAELVWSLPYQDQVTLLTAVMIPLVRFHSKSEKVASQMLVNLLSCFNYLEVWPPPYVLTKPRNPSFFIKPTTNEQPRDFSLKVHGILTQFASSVESITALEILNIGAQGKKNYIELLKMTILQP